MFGGAFWSHWLRLFGWVLNFINAHELLQDAVVNANERISLLRGQPLSFDQVNIGGRCREPSAKRTEVRGKTVHLGCLSVEAVSGSSPFSYSPALLRQMIKCIQLCTHTRTRTCKHVQYMCIAIYLYTYIHDTHKQRLNLSWVGVFEQFKGHLCPV